MRTKVVNVGRTKVVNVGRTKSVKKVIAFKIKEAITFKKWTNAEFARRAHVGPSQITVWLNGEHNFTVEALVKLEDLLDIQLIAGI